MRPGSIRVSFTWNKERCRETLDLKPSEAHRKYAERLVDQINREIGLGTFDYARHFPDSARAKAAARSSPAACTTFGGYADLYLLVVGAHKPATEVCELAAATRSQYGRQVKFWKTRPLEAGGTLADRPMAALRHSELAALIGAQSWSSNKRRNNMLIPLRGIFDLWVADDPTARVSPLRGIENAKVQKKKPDPYSRAEAELIVADMYKHYDERVGLYYELAFFSGLRPEEEIALLWTKINKRRHVGRIDRARTFKGTEKETKTGVARDVKFNSRAWAAIEKMQKWTALKPHGHVLENPRTDKPWASEADQRDLYWTPTLRRLGLPHKPAYATRSTYATMCLMAGMNPAKVAKNMGHSKRVFWEMYAEWIDEADGGREDAKLEAELARDLLTEDVASGGD